MARLWQRFSKKTRMTILGLVAAGLFVAVFLSYGDLPYERLPLPENIRRQERKIERLQKELDQAERFEEKRQQKMARLRELADPFWRTDDQASAADVRTELDRIARRAQVTIQNTRLVGDKPEEYTDYVLSVEVSVQIKAPMREISRLLA